MSLRSCVISVGLAVVVVAESGARAQTPCVREIDAQLDALEVASEAVVRIDVIDEIDSLGLVLGHNAWIELKSCQGRLILRFGEACVLEQAYTVGSCRLPRVSHH